MTVTVKKGTAHGSIAAPPSKSMAHRALICGAMTDGSVIRGVSFSRDIRATLSCLQALGANVKINGDIVNIGGLCKRQNIMGAKLFCDESGSTLRFLVPLCLLSAEKTVFSGSERLFSRPLCEYETLCRENGLLFLQKKNSLTVKGPLENSCFSVCGDISSQFISGLLFALPLFDDGGHINITTETQSRSYIDMTVAALKNYGIDVLQKDSVISVPRGQKYTACDLTVEGDCSNAAFFEALNAFGGNVSVTGISNNTVQGDRVYYQLINRLCDGHPVIDLSDCPDLAPVLFAVAAAKNGAVFTGTHRLRYKESDRALAMENELCKFGVNIIVEDDSVTVPKTLLHTPDIPLCSHNDHRIAMALAVLCTKFGGTIEGAEAVAKSFPDFFERLCSLGIEIKVNNNEIG